MTKFNSEYIWSGNMREGERLVDRWTELKDLHPGNLMIQRHSAYGCGSCQMLFVAWIDGYSGDEPICWKCYVKPELEVDPLSYCVEFNTWSDVRDYGDTVYESDARELFPQLDDLPYSS